MVGTVASYHFKRNGQNEFNPGIGVERGVSDRWRAIGGLYHNSSNKLTVYGGATYGIAHWGQWHAFSMGAVATGYDGNKPGIIGGVGLAYEGQVGGVNVILLPGAGGVLGFQVKSRW